MPAIKTLVMFLRHHQSPIQASAVFRATASRAAAHNWRGEHFRPPWCRRGTDLLILKLTIVPLGLLVFGIVERLHGPRVAGWLAGFPIVGGPLLLFITLDHGLAFGAQAALGAYFGLVPWLAFTMTYAFCSRAPELAVVHGHRLRRSGPWWRCWWSDLQDAAHAGWNWCHWRAFWAPCSSIRGRTFGRGTRACLVGAACPHDRRRGADRRSSPSSPARWAATGQASSPPFR